MNLNEPIPFPNVAQVDKEIRASIERLEVKAKAYENLALIATGPNWVTMKESIKDLTEQLTKKLITEKEHLEVIRLQEAVKSYTFFLNLPSSAKEAADRIRTEIQRRSLLSR